jgi:hypothetical protein
MDENFRLKLELVEKGEALRRAASISFALWHASAVHPDLTFCICCFACCTARL